MLVKSFVSIIAAALLMVSAAPQVRAASVGKVTLVKAWAFERVMPKDWEDLFINNEVFSNQRIRTPAEAAVHVHLLDGADFRVGANSEVVIDKFVFDPSKSTGKLVTTLGKGMFRFISGKVKDYEIGAPSATIGIRGTDIIVAVLANGNTLLQVKKGIAEITPCIREPDGQSECADEATLVFAGETALVVAGTLIVHLGVAMPYDPGLDDDGGLAGLETSAGGRGNGRFGPRFGPSDNHEHLLLRVLRQTIQSPQVTSPWD